MRDFKDKSVLIFGLGLNMGGVGSAKFFASNRAKVRVTDLKSADILKSSIEELKDFPDIEYTLGEHKNEDIDWADIIIRNPAIKDNNPYLEYARKLGKKIETDFSIFLEYVDQKKIIAITGTKGKSTTASLIYEVIKASGKNVVFAGNIGKSILEIIPYLGKDPWVIVEISSFQLQLLNNKGFAPKIAVITNIYPDHLNWHSSMEEYAAAKKSIAANQSDSDYLIIGCDIDSKTAEDVKSKILQSCGEDFMEDFLIYYPRIDFLPLKGSANLDNYAAATTVCEILEISKGEIFKSFQNFKGAPFRMQEIGEFNGIKIINDSTATNPVPTIKALQTVGPCLLIAGGMNKGLEYHKLAAEIENGNVKALYLLKGDATSELQKYIRNTSLIKGKGLYDNLEELLIELKKEAKTGDTILFSPGATSFNLFQNEFDRGRKFNEAVQKVFK